jgi:copper(I)-binding protein
LEEFMQLIKHLVFTGAVLALCSVALADDFKVGDLMIGAPWSRATPAGANTGAGYFTIENHGTATDRLIGGSSPVAVKVEVHQMTMTDGVMRMRPVDGGLAVEPGKSVTLEPNGFHVMLIGLKAPLKTGDKISATLQFEKAGKVDVQFEVKGIGTTTPAQDQGSDHGSMGKMKM